jgi:outer membrane murein-binding lipoprotein Lpp
VNADDIQKIGEVLAVLIIAVLNFLQNRKLKHESRAAKKEAVEAKSQADKTDEKVSDLDNRSAANIQGETIKSYEQLLKVVRAEMAEKLLHADEVSKDLAAKLDKTQADLEKTTAESAQNKTDHVECERKNEELNRRISSLEMGLLDRGILATKEVENKVDTLTAKVDGIAMDLKAVVQWMPSTLGKTKDAT